MKITKKEFKKNINYSYNGYTYKNTKDLKISKFKENIEKYIYDNDYNDYNYDYFDEDDNFLENLYEKELKNKIKIDYINSHDILNFKSEYNQIIKFISANKCKNNIFRKKFNIDTIFNGKDLQSNLSYKDIIDISSMLANISNISVSIKVYLKLKKFTKNFEVIKF